MNEIVRVSLENEMDLILAHKQSMKLGELCGLTLAAQTSFATAVSEVSRNVIDEPKNASLVLGVTHKKNTEKFIIAIIHDGRVKERVALNEGYRYAKRLVEQISQTRTDGDSQIELRFKIPATTRLDAETIEKWGTILNTDPAVSPYEEIKRKNRQLLQMADKLRDSEQSYRTLTDSLPLIIYTMNSEGRVTYANEWLTEYSGMTTEMLNTNKWKGFVHDEDFVTGWKSWDDAINGSAPRNISRRLKAKATGEYKWHTGVTMPMLDDEGNTVQWNCFLVDVDAQKKIEQALKDNDELKETKRELEDKVAQLHQSNQELEQFAYVASHDLQEPLRKISFYSDYLEKKLGGTLAQDTALFLSNIINASERMRLLIHDILAYSTISKNKVFASTDLNKIAADALQDLEIAINEKSARVSISELPMIEGNEVLLKQLFENLLSNSLKFTAPGRTPIIKITASVEEDIVTLLFEDNGIGFEDQYIHKMFDLFQRLHSREKYAGTGIGLGICKKIVIEHNGMITAKGIVDKGATFTVKLPMRHVM